MVLRDVIDRHAVTNPLALRWLQRQLLAHPGGAFSVKKHYDTLRSQGVRVGKDTLHAYLGYLEDAFLVRTVSLHAASERQRMVNPRKAYPVDPGLISLFARAAAAIRAGPWRPSSCWSWSGAAGPFPTSARPKGGRSTSSPIGRERRRCSCRSASTPPTTRPGSGRCAPSGRRAARTAMRASSS